MKSPATDLDKGDPGDDVGLRFQYQYCYAAINATRLVTNDDELSLVICENHEDVLVKRPSGTFVAIQVKTRDLDQPPFRANNEQVRKALVRFCKLDARYTDTFECFDFVTNHVFWEDEENAKNLPWILAKLKKRGHVKGLKGENPVRELVDSLSASAGIEIESVAKTLLKTKISSKKDTLRSISNDLQSAVAECPGLAQQPYAVVVRIASALRALATDASTKALAGPVSDLHAAGSDFAVIVKEQLLAGKCIDRAEVLKIINEQIEIEQTFETLNISGLISPDELPYGLETMVVKMARGGLQSLRIQEMQDLVHALQTMYVRWVRKFGPAVADNRYEDLLARVKVDCVEARVAVQEGGDPYGPAMYDALFDRLKARVQEESDTLYGCRPEHLLGAAGTLTENCIVLCVDTTACSVAVAGDYAETFTEAMFEEGQGLPHAYHRSKLESEKLVRASELDYRIYRPSAVVGDSKTGAMDRIDGVYFSFGAIKKLAYALPGWARVPVPRIRGRFNLVPVDYVADAMAHIAFADSDARSFTWWIQSRPPS